MATKIQWTDEVWNPVRGCSRVSPGCRNCYAERQANRHSGPGRPYEGLTHLVGGRPQWTGEVRLVPELLEEPLRWKAPRRVFVNSMSDLFHEGVPDGFICQVFKVMGRAKRHTFQVLTKRAVRMQRFMREQTNAHAIRMFEEQDFFVRWPYPNVWLGVSVEDQARADERIPHLLETPAAVRFLSVEPLLAPVDLDPWFGYPASHAEQAAMRSVFPHGLPAGSLNEVLSRQQEQNRRSLHWVIVGGESGPGARPCRLDWVRSLVRQCREARVAVFCKQIGAVAARESGSKDPKGGRMEDWPADLRIREFPNVLPEAR